MHGWLHTNNKKQTLQFLGQFFILPFKPMLGVNLRGMGNIKVGLILFLLAVFTSGFGSKICTKNCSGIFLKNLICETILTETHEAGKHYKSFAKDLGIHQSTIRQTVSKVATIPSSCRPVKITPRAQLEIFQEVRRTPGIRKYNLQKPTLKPH